MIFGFNENKGREDISELLDGHLLWSNNLWTGNVEFNVPGVNYINDINDHLTDYDRLFLKYKWFYEGQQNPEVGWVKITNNFNTYTPIVSQNVIGTGFILNKRSFYIPPGGTDNCFIISSNYKGELRNGAWSMVVDDHQNIPIALYGYKRNIITPIEDNSSNQWFS